MNQYRMRLVRSIANRLGAILTGNGALYGVEARLRDACASLILEVAGARIEHHGHMPVAVLEDGTVIADEGDNHASERALDAAVDRWLASGTPPSDIARALPLASGTEVIAASMGCDIDRVAALAYAFHSATIEDGDATLTVQNNGHRLHGIYLRRGLRWEDGIIGVVSKPLPQSLRMALAGKPVSAVVADTAIGDRIITRVIDADPRERVLRIRTTDTDKFI